jgi:hypothetical protein
MPGLIYLIQPPQCVGTNCYKIGMSKSSAMRRIRDYGSGCINVVSRECDNPLAVEKELIELFNSRFGAPVRGREWFSGSKLDMIEAYNDCFDQYAICNDVNCTDTGTEITWHTKRRIRKPKIVYKHGSIAKLSDLKAVHPGITGPKLLAMNPAWTISPKKICTHCKRRHFKGCCSAYNCASCITCRYVINIEITV